MISLCITTYNRTGLLFESFKQVLDDSRVSEIVIQDDCSDGLIFAQIYNEIHNPFGKTKVKLYQNHENMDCYRNKRQAISNASNEWVIILDSDNIITKEYIDRIEDLWMAGLNPKTVYQPSFAKPHFNFTSHEGLLVDRRNVARHMNESMFSTMLNAMNYFVNRDEYLRVWDGSVDPVTSDSIFQNYNWLKSGNSIYVVPGLEYEHRVHEGGHYRNNVRRTPHGFHQEIENKLKQLS